MLSNQDKKKIGALVGILVAGTGVLFGALKLNEKPNTIVDNGLSGSYQESFEEAHSSSVESSIIAEGPGFDTQESLSRVSYDSMSLPENSKPESSEKSGNLVVRPSTSSQKLTQEASSKAPASEKANTTEKAPSSNEAKPNTPSSNEAKPNTSSKAPASSKVASSTQQAQESQSTSERTPEEESSLALAKASEEAAAKVPSTPSSKALAELPVFESQRLGNTKVVFYQHPSLSLGLDLRTQQKMAEQLYVFPTKDGFVLFPRQMMSLMGMEEKEFKEKLEKRLKIPGAITVSLVDAKKKEELKKADKANSLRFTEAEDGRFYVIQKEEKDLERYQKVYGMLDKTLSPQFVAENLSTAGMIGNPPKEAKDVTLGTQQAEWEKLVSMMKDNPAVVEWNWNLPLLASSDGYLYEGKDLRANVPEGNPSYAFGRMDLNDDDVPEYLIHATTAGSKEGTAAGYWAILEPTPSGLKVANIINQGNGDLLRHQDKLILPTMDQNKDTVSLAVQETNLAKGTDREDLPRVVFQATGKMTGRELAQTYPDESLVPMKDMVYRFKMKDLEKLLDYAVEVMGEASRVELIGSVTDEKTGWTNPHGTRETKIEDPLLYLQERYPDLPLTPDRLKKATSTATFKDLEDALTPGGFDRVE